MRFIVADDHILVRESIINSLKNEFRNLDVAEVSRGDELIAALNLSGNVDLICFDLKMPNTDPYLTIVQIKKNWPEIPLLVLSAAEDNLNVQRTIDAGASGFVSKSVAFSELLEAVRHLLQGGTYFHKPIEQDGLSHSEQVIVKITRRQAEVLSYLALGKANREIAEELDLSESTVKIHVANIFRQLKVKNRTEAVLKAKSLDLI